MTNEERIERALIFYRVIYGVSDTSNEEDVIDSPTDLRHICDRAKLALGELDSIAHGHCMAKLEEALKGFLHPWLRHRPRSRAGASGKFIPVLSFHFSPATQLHRINENSDR